MRYAVFTDIHANLEALEAVLAKIDELAKDEPIDQLWFLGDLVGYGPNPNECITRLRARTDVIIAGNHDWAAVGKLDLEDFSAAARISAEWTAQQLTEEHREFLANLPERLEMGECTLVHGSPFGPLWEYLTSEALAERSFQHFSSRLCFVGHTHVPVIFQQPDTIANAPTTPLGETVQNGAAHTSPTDALPVEVDSELSEPGKISETGEESRESRESGEISEDVADMATIAAIQHTTKAAADAESAYADPDTGKPMSESDANVVLEQHATPAEHINEQAEVDIIVATDEREPDDDVDGVDGVENSENTEHNEDTDEAAGNDEDDEGDDTERISSPEAIENTIDIDIEESENDDDVLLADEDSVEDERVEDEDDAHSTEDRLNNEIEELLELLGLSESMVQVTNEMLEPPEGDWKLAQGYRAIVNPGGVGQPRDGDPRAAFMIYDTERGFTFYRVPYDMRPTQEKIIRANLPHYLAIRLAYGR